MSDEPKDDWVNCFPTHIVLSDEDWEEFMRVMQGAANANAVDSWGRKAASGLVPQTGHRMITRYFVARWLAALPTEGTMAGWLRGIANSLPGRTQSELGRRLFRAADLLEGRACGS